MQRMLRSGFYILEMITYSIAKSYFSARLQKLCYPFAFSESSLRLKCKGLYESRNNITSLSIPRRKYPKFLIDLGIR